VNCPFKTEVLRKSLSLGKQEVFPCPSRRCFIPSPATSDALITAIKYENNNGGVSEALRL
jgi:hypothetical protein